MNPGPPKPPFPLYILAGGQSRRFGSDKARASFHGRPLICHVSESFGDAVSTCVVVAARADAYDDLGLVTIGDREPGRGPLGGLQTALAHAAESHPGWIVLAACDLLQATPDAVGLLASAVGSGIDRVAVFRSEHGLEPFPGLYHTSLLSHLAEQRDRGATSMRRLLMSVEPGIRLVDWPGFANPYIDADTSLELAQAQQNSSGLS